MDYFIVFAVFSIVELLRHLIVGEVLGNKFIWGNWIAVFFFGWFGTSIWRTGVDPTYDFDLFVQIGFPIAIVATMLALNGLIFWYNIEKKDEIKLWPTMLSYAIILTGMLLFTLVFLPMRNGEYELKNTLMFKCIIFVVFALVELWRQFWIYSDWEDEVISWRDYGSAFVVGLCAVAVCYHVGYIVAVIVVCWLYNVFFVPVVFELTRSVESFKIWGGMFERYKASDYPWKRGDCFLYFLGCALLFAVYVFSIIKRLRFDPEPFWFL